MTTPSLRRRFARMSPWLLVLVAVLVFEISPSGLNPRIVAATPPPAKKEKEKEKRYALIFGTVWGPDDHPVYGVTVKIRRAKDKKAKWEVFSDHHGEFAQRVPAGEADYIIWADLKGFKPADGKPLRFGKEVTVHVYDDEREDTGLHLTQQ